MLLPLRELLAVPGLLFHIVEDLNRGIYRSTTQFVDCDTGALNDEDFPGRCSPSKYRAGANKLAKSDLLK